MKKILLTVITKKALTASLVCLLLFCGNKSFAQLSGVKTIPGDYANISDAIADLDANGVAAPGVTFNIAAGHTESWDLNANPGINTIGGLASGSASAPVVFQKSGAGADPLISVSGTDTTDAGIIIQASSYITINGIDITDAGTAQSNWVEYGIAIINDGGFSAVGSQHNTIKNCTITLSANDNSFSDGGVLFNDPFGLNSTVGIFQVWSTFDFSGSPFSFGGIEATNSFNTYYSNTIHNAGVGIALSMQSINSINDIYDTNDDIGTLGANTITGTGLEEVQGIYENTQVASHIQNNIINLSSTQPAFNSINGIFVSNQSGSGQGTTEIDHNNILLNSSGDTSLAFSTGFNGIDLQNGNSEIYKVHDNTVHNCTGDFRSFNGISNDGSSASPVVNVYNNVITGNNIANTPGGLSITGINDAGGAGDSINIHDNQVSALSNDNTGNVYGANLTGNAIYQVYNNKIFTLFSASGAGPLIYGISVTGQLDASSIIYNNFISDLTTNGTGIYGIYSKSGNSFGLYYNSIYLNQTTGINSAFVSYCIYLSNNSSNPVTVTDNLVVNTSTPGSGSGGITATLLVTGGTFNFDGYGTSSDHNDYYAGVSGQKNLIFQGDQDSYQDLGSFSTASNTDISSASLDPGFTSQTDLHSTHMTNPGAIVFGTPLSFITTDIDGNNRGITSTDMGADEFGTCVALGAVAKPGGPASRCFGSGTSVYTIPAVTNATSYSWTVTGAGNTISADPGSNTASVNWGASFTGHAIVSVVAKNLCHTSAASTISVAVNATPTEITSSPASKTDAADFGVAVDASGNVYVADEGFGLIEKLSPNGTTTSFNNTIVEPTGLAIDGAGNLYVTDRFTNSIYKIAPNGTTSTFLDLSSGAVQLEGIAMDATGTNLYVTDWGGLEVYKIDIATATPTVFAGTGIAGNDGDGGPATSADIGTGANGLEEIAVDASNNVYIADPGNNRVRMVAGTTANGHVIGNIYNFAGSASDITGNSGDGGLATAALLSAPTGVRTDATGNVYIADFGNANVRVVNPDGIINTLVNTSGTPGNTGDGGPAAAATLTSPYGLAVDNSGDLYISDMGNTSVREVFASLPPAINPIATSICPGSGPGSITASSSGATSYTWSITAGAGTISGTGTHANVTWNATFSGTATISVTATNGCGSTPASAVQVVSSFPVGGTVLPIESIICTGGTQALTASGASGNDLQWQISSDNVNWTYIAGATTTAYTTAPADGGTNKFYRMVSKSTACWDVASTTAEVDVSKQVINVTATAITDNSITLSWSPAGTGNYNINYSGTSSGLLTSITPPKTITPLSANGNYSVTVTQTGISLTGCPASGTLAGLNTLCAVPTNLTATSSIPGQILVSWNGPAGNYRVFYHPLYSYISYFTKDVINATSVVLTKQGNNKLYSSGTYEIFVTRLDCPSAGDLGQQTGRVYTTLLPNPVNCATPVIDTVFSNCPVALEVKLHGSPTGNYNVYFQRLTPVLQQVHSYGITGGDFVLSAIAGDQYNISADSKCADGSVSTLYLYPGTSTVKPTCNAPANLVLSNPTCKGFTASWNADQCLSNTVSGYALYMRQAGTINYNSYPAPSSALGPHEIVTFLGRGKNMQVFVRSMYSCGASITYGPSSPVVTITTLSAGCRDEDETDEPQEIKPDAQQYSADNDEVFSLYPNPNSGEFTVNLSRLSNDEDAVRIEVINMMGQTIITHLTSISDGHMNEFINLPSGTAAGTYIVRLTAGKNVYTAKMNISR